MVSVFTKAFLLSIIVFSAGLVVGIWLDNSRVEEFRNTISGEEINFNDARLQNLYYQTISNSSDFCDAAEKANVDFSYRIFEEGKEIERFETVNRFAPQILDQKKRYTLLQLQFWMNSVHLKEKCSKNYTTLLYFYSSNNDSIANDQNVQSHVILDFISRCGPEKLLSAPIPINLDIGTVNLLKEKYKIIEAPAILINEKTVLEGLQSKEELEKYIEC